MTCLILEGSAGRTDGSLPVSEVLLPGSASVLVLVPVTGPVLVLVALVWLCVPVRAV